MKENDDAIKHYEETLANSPRRMPPSGSGSGSGSDEIVDETTYISSRLPDVSEGIFSWRPEVTFYVNFNSNNPDTLNDPLKRKRVTISHLLINFVPTSPTIIVDNLVYNPFRLFNLGPFGRVGKAKDTLEIHVQCTLKVLSRTLSYDEYGNPVYTPNPTLEYSFDRMFVITTDEDSITGYNFG